MNGGGSGGGSGALGGHTYPNDNLDDNTFHGGGGSGGSGPEISEIDRKKRYEKGIQDIVLWDGDLKTLNDKFNGKIHQQLFGPKYGYADEQTFYSAERETSTLIKYYSDSQIIFKAKELVMNAGYAGLVNKKIDLKIGGTSNLSFVTVQGTPIIRYEK